MNEVCVGTGKRWEHVKLLPGTCLVGRLLQVQSETGRAMELGGRQKACPQIACL